MFKDAGKRAEDQTDQQMWSLPSGSLQLKVQPGHHLQATQPLGIFLGLEFPQPVLGVGQMFVLAVLQSSQ